jgi:(1->4)-alpha-D-glucan 1-alpha-D-glucosylmutase
VHANGWADTMLQLPEGPWRDVLSERTYAGEVPIRELWEMFPVALLVSSTKP